MIVNYITGYVRIKYGTRLFNGLPMYFFQEIGAKITVSAFETVVMFFTV